MKTYYQVEYWNKLFNLWIKHCHKKYKTLQNAKDEISSYKDHKLGLKLRIIKIEIIK